MLKSAAQFQMAQSIRQELKPVFLSADHARLRSSAAYYSSNLQDGQEGGQI